MDSSCNGVEEKMLFSLYSQMPQAEKKGGRRRRKKVRAESDAEGKKRRLSDEQVRFLEHRFVEERKLESGRKVHLATELGLEPKQVAVWFQNRRARWKNKQLEEEYLRLKSHHDAAVVDKCHLENEVLKLKERLLEAEEEIRRLAAPGGGSPSSSSFSTDVRQPELGEFRVDGDDLMYMNDEYNSLSNYMEWGYLYGM